MFVCFIVLNTRPRTHTPAPPARAATPVFASMAHRYYPPSSNGCLLGGGAERRGGLRTCGLRRSAARRLRAEGPGESGQPRGSPSAQSRGAKPSLREN